MKTRLELRDPKGDKYWEINHTGDSYSAQWGRVGAARPERKFESFPSVSAARDAAKRLIDEKLAKGYELISRDAPADPEAPSRLEPPLRDAGIENGFAAMLTAGRYPLDRVPIGVLLSNAVMMHGDGGGNAWMLHLSPCGGAWWACIDHETYELFDFFAEPVFDVVCERERVADRYRGDADEVEAVYEREAPSVTREVRERVRRELDRLWFRSSQIVGCLYGTSPGAPAPLATERANPRFVDVPGYGVYALLHATLAGNDDEARALATQLSASSLRVVRDAAALVLRGDQGFEAAGVNLVTARGAFTVT